MTDRTEKCSPRNKNLDQIIYMIWSTFMLVLSNTAKMHLYSVSAKGSLRDKIHVLGTGARDFMKLPEIFVNNCFIQQNIPLTEVHMSDVDEANSPGTEFFLDFLCGVWLVIAKPWNISKRGDDKVFKTGVKAVKDIFDLATDEERQLLWEWLNKRIRMWREDFITINQDIRATEGNNHFLIYAQAEYVQLMAAWSLFNEVFDSGADQVAAINTLGELKDAAQFIDMQREDLHLDVPCPVYLKRISNGGYREYYGIISNFARVLNMPYKWATDFSNTYYNGL